MYQMNHSVASSSVAASDALNAARIEDSTLNDTRFSGFEPQQEQAPQNNGDGDGDGDGIPIEDDSTNPYHTDEDTYMNQTGPLLAPESPKPFQSPLGLAATENVNNDGGFYDAHNNASDDSGSVPTMLQFTNMYNDASQTNALNEPSALSTSMSTNRTNASTVFREQPPPTTTTRDPKQERVVRKYTQRSLSSPQPKDRANSAETRTDADISDGAPERYETQQKQKQRQQPAKQEQQPAAKTKQTRGRSLLKADPPQKASGRGWFRRSITPQEKEKQKKQKEQQQQQQNQNQRETSADKGENGRSRSWLGTFRGRAIAGKPDPGALVVVEPDKDRSLSRASRTGSVSDGEVEKLGPTINATASSDDGSPSQPFPPVQQSLSQPQQTAGPPEQTLFATKKMVQSLTKNPQAEVTPESADEALRELRSLQSELKDLRRQRPPDVKQLQLELEAAQKAASQLEGLNKNYKRAQKEMLQDMQQAQAELEKYREARDNGSLAAASSTATTAPVSNRETQRLAEELAATMAELLALQEQHQALLAETSKKKHSRLMMHRQPSRGDVQDMMGDSASRDMDNGSNDDDNSAYHQHETQLNLQKDLAHAMATISKLEEENEHYRKQLLKLETMDERFRQVQAERDEYASQLSDIQQAYTFGGKESQNQASNATIERLQEEKTQLLSSLKSLEEKIGKLETKNKNQKEIFQTAIEIKDVELKINQKERDLLASRLDEIQQEQQGGKQEEELKQLKDQLQKAIDKETELLSKLELESSHKDILTQEMETVLLEKEALEKLLDEQQQESNEQMEEVVTELNVQIAQLDAKIKLHENEMADLKDQHRLETLKSKRSTDEQMSELQRQVEQHESTLASRDEQIIKLQEEAQELEEQMERARKQVVVSHRRAPSTESSDDHSTERLSALRSRLDKHEETMRSKVQSIRRMDSPGRNQHDPNNNGNTPMVAPSSNSITSSTTTSSSGSTSPAEPTLVVATPVGSAPSITKSVQEMEESMQKREAQIVQLEQELSTAQVQLKEQKAKISKDESRIRELVQAQKQGQERMFRLEQELDQTKTQMEETMARFNHESDLNEQEMETLITQLAEKEQRCADLENQMAELEKEKAAAEEDRLTAEAALVEAQHNFETLELQLERVSQQIVESNNKNSNGKGIAAGDDDTHAASTSSDAQEQELQRLKMRLAEADSKIEMLEQFIQEDMGGNADLSFAGGGAADGAALQDTLQQRDKELERLRSETETCHDQLSRARSNLHESELARAHAQAKVTQLSSILEKQRTEKSKNGSKNDEEVDLQLYKKCIEVAEVSAEKEELAQKLRMTETALRRLQQEAEGGESSGEQQQQQQQLHVQLVEAELRFDAAQEKLAAAEKASRELEQQNERLRQGSGGAGGKNGAVSTAGLPDDVATRIKFLEEQNAAYAASLKALRMEYATRHEGTAYV